MNYICDGVYIGNVDDAYETDKLKEAGITHILTLEIKPLRKEATEGFTYKYVHAFDMENQDLLMYMEDCLSFLEEGCKSGGVFVHCFAGRSRSATIVIAYLMRKFDMSFEETLKMTNRQRNVCPNPGFRSQLELFELMGNKVDPQHQHYKLYKLNILADMMRLGQGTESTEDMLKSHLNHDPATAAVSKGTTEVMFKCRKCRRTLFKKSSVVPHREGIGDAAFDWRKSQAQDGTTGEKKDCNLSLFIEPVSWMGREISQLEGKISCPKCSAKLGSFNWSGERCPCGTWVTPAFHIQTTKVDEYSPPRIPQVQVRMPRSLPQLQHKLAMDSGQESSNQNREEVK